MELSLKAGLIGLRPVHPSLHNKAGSTAAYLVKQLPSLLGSIERESTREERK